MGAVPPVSCMKNVFLHVVVVVFHVATTAAATIVFFQALTTTGFAVPSSRPVSLSSSRLHSSNTQVNGENQVAVETRAQSSSSSSSSLPSPPTPLPSPPTPPLPPIALAEPSVFRSLRPPGFENGWYHDGGSAGAFAGAGSGSLTEQGTSSSEEGDDDILYYREQQQRWRRPEFNVAREEEDGEFGHPFMRQRGEYDDDDDDRREWWETSSPSPRERRAVWETPPSPLRRTTSPSLRRGSTSTSQRGVDSSSTSADSRYYHRDVRGDDHVDKEIRSIENKWLSDVLGRDRSAFWETPLSPARRGSSSGSGSRGRHENDDDRGGGRDNHWLSDVGIGGGGGDRARWETSPSRKRETSSRSRSRRRQRRSGGVGGTSSTSAYRDRKERRSYQNDRRWSDNRPRRRFGDLRSYANDGRSGNRRQQQQQRRHRFGGLGDYDDDDNDEYWYDNGAGAPSYYRDDYDNSGYGYGYGYGSDYDSSEYSTFDQAGYSGSSSPSGRYGGVVEKRGFGDGLRQRRQQQQQQQQSGGAPYFTGSSSSSPSRRRRQADSLLPITGSSRRTWRNLPGSDGGGPVVIKLETDGRPLDAEYELYEGPGHRRHGMRVYSQDGYLCPFLATVEIDSDLDASAAASCESVSSIRNTGSLEFPLYGGVGTVGSDRIAPAFPKQSTAEIQGSGSLRTWSLDRHVDRVRISVKAEAEYHAIIELWQGPGAAKQITEVFNEKGRPMSAIIDCPWRGGGTIHIRNIGPMEFPLTASVEPYHHPDRDDDHDDEDNQYCEGERRVVINGKGNSDCEDGGDVDEGGEDDR